MSDIPNLSGLLEPLKTMYPVAWAKAKAPHDDGEFNARACAWLHYNHGYPLVGRNGKRGNPNDLSRDIINWRHQGSNYDPTNGNEPCQIIDIIAAHESAEASLAWFYPDPNGPGAWVQPLTMAQIDAGGPPATPQVPPYPGDEVFDAIGVALFADYAQAGQPPNPQMGRWFGRTTYDWLAKVVPTLEASIAKHRAEWRAILGLPPL